MRLKRRVALLGLRPAAWYPGCDCDSAVLPVI